MTTHGVNQFYDGSTLLEPLAKATDLPTDQLNFVACQLFALALGFPYRTVLGPHRTSPTTRHFVQILVGIPLAYFCFGRQIVHLIVQSAFCLVLMRIFTPGVMEKIVLAMAMGYLCMCHQYRMYYDYGGYTLDITGPLMLNTQRLSSMAFNLRDGHETDESKLTPMMRRLAVKEMPSLLQSASYIFCFHGLMCGPFCFYKDYIAFIDGTNYVSRPAQNSKTDNHHMRLPPPAPGLVLLKKLLTCIIFGFSTVAVLPRLPTTLITGSEFEERNFLVRSFLVTLLPILQRHKYYVAWKLGEAVNVSSGLGYNGVDEKGRPRWNLVDNADILQIELSTSVKQMLDHWNMSTMVWLRYVVYERWRTVAGVFFFSAFWHGFYAGYYLTFLGTALILETSRLLRKQLRPRFQTTPRRAKLYNIMTFCATHICMPYVGFPFMLLEFIPCIKVYRSLYFWQHIAAVVLLGMMSVVRPAKRKSG